MSAPTRLGSYEILGPIGAGGMGEVYRARERGSIARSPSRSYRHRWRRTLTALARFEREAMSVAKLSHPNILSIFELAQDAGRAFVVTELVDGETLRARLDPGLLPPRRAVALRAADSEGNGRRARARHRASRPEARERDDYARRPGQDSRLRSGQVDRDAAARDDDARRRPRH